MMPTDLECGCRIGGSVERLCSYHEGYEDGADRYREALVGLLDSLERGDGFMAQERMQAAGRLLGYARYDGSDAAS